MSYFRQFPRKQYFIDDNQEAMVVDVTKRFAFTQAFKDNGDIFIKYKMRDHESFEDIAHRMYGKADFHWVLLLFNDIVDPFRDMPQDSNTLKNVIDKNYPGYALFMAVNEFDGNYVVGETVKAATFDSNGVTTDIAYRAVVEGWDATYRRLVVSGEINTTTLDLTNLNLKIIGETSKASSTLKRRILNKLAVHHFEDLSGEEVGPISNLLSSGTSPLESYVAQTTNPLYNTISNADYEENINEKKKEIAVLRPEYLEKVMVEMQTMFS